MRNFFEKHIALFLSSLVILSCFSLLCHAEPIAYWTFDNAADIEFDAVGTDNGASSTGVAYASSGMFGGAADFGTLADNCYITLGDTSDFDSTTGYTVSAWYNSNGNTIDDGQKILHITTEDGNLGTALTLKSTGNLEPFIRDASRQRIELAGVANVTDDAWHNLIYVYDPETKSINAYVDGILDCSGDNQAIGTVAGFTKGKIGVHASIDGHQNLGGLLDDMVVMSNTISAEDVALINGLGRLAGVSLANYTEMEAVKAAFANGPGSSAIAGGLTWTYASDLGSTTIGTIGGSAATGDAFIVLDSAGNGISLVPEPGTFLLLATGLFGLLAGARRKR